MRSNSRSGQTKSRSEKGRLTLFVLFALIAAFIIIVSPKEPTGHALNVDASGNSAATLQSLVISEVMSSNTSALPDEDGRFADWFEIVNKGDTPIQLKDLTLSNRSDKAKFIFPDDLLGPGERRIIFCDNTNRNVAGQPYHAKFKLSSLGVTLFMFDASGNQFSSLTVPTMNVNESYALTEAGHYQIVEYYSPGYPNTREGHLAYMGNYHVDSGSLKINEIMPAPRSGLRDEDGELSDWIELINESNQAIDLNAYALSDNEGRPVKWRFPKGAVIQPHSAYIVFCSKKDRMSPQGFPHTNFALSAEGETLILSTVQGQLVDRVAYENIPADASYGRNPQTGNWQVFHLATPGAPNTNEGANQADHYLRAINPYKVYISEAMSSNNSIRAHERAPISDWVELYNAGSTAVDLTLFGLSDNINWPRKWQFPHGTSIQPGEHKVIYLSKSKTPGTDASALQASYAIKRAGGETLTLSDSQGTVLDKLYMPSVPTDTSFGRETSRDGFFYFDTPTPGAPNNLGFTGFSMPPILSNAGGMYKQNLSLSISSEDGSAIRYTLDGSIPTLENSTEYTGPIEINADVVVRARAFKTGLQPSRVVTATYIMKAYYTMPVVSLVMDPYELWNNTNGMLAAGEGVDLAAYKHIPFKHPTPLYRQFGKEFRPGFAEMFDSEDGHTYFSQNIEFALIGQYSLDMPQKSFKLKAKASIGERYFNARVFEDRPFEQYKSLVLRVSGNDAVWTRMVDGVQSRLVDQLQDTTVIHQAWRPVIVYLNGKYWGHYNLRERVSRYFVAQHEGIPMEKADDMTILEASWKSYYGSNSEYRKMIQRIKKSDPRNNPEDLQYILDNVDIDNMFDYIIFQMFFCNTDSGNIRFYRVPGGKWKFIMFDMDYGLFNSSHNGIRNMMNPKGHGSNNDIDNTLWVKTLQNEEMLDRFLKRFGEIFRFFSIERMLAQVDTCYAEISPEMTMHFERWAASNLKNISFDQPQTVDGCMRYWNERVARLRNVIKKRPRHCWVQVQEWFKISDSKMIEYFGDKPEFPADAELNKLDKAIR